MRKIFGCFSARSAEELFYDFCNPATIPWKHPKGPSGLETKTWEIWESRENPQQKQGGGGRSFPEVPRFGVQKRRGGVFVKGIFRSQTCGIRGLNVPQRTLAYTNASDEGGSEEGGGRSEE